MPFVRSRVLGFALLVLSCAPNKTSAPEGSSPGSDASADSSIVSEASSDVHSGSCGGDFVNGKVDKSKLGPVCSYVDGGLHFTDCPPGSTCIGFGLLDEQIPIFAPTDALRQGARS